MKRLFTITVFFCALNVVASSQAPVARQLTYWCEPVEKLAGLEAVTVRELDGQHILGVYTESRRWGTVDEHLSSVDLAISSGQEFFNSNEDKVQLTIALGSSNKKIPGDTFAGKLLDQRFDFNAEVSCEYLP